MHNLDTECVLAITTTSCQTLHLGDTLYGDEAIAAIAGSLRYININIYTYKIHNIYIYIYYYYYYY